LAIGGYFHMATRTEVAEVAADAASEMEQIIASEDLGEIRVADPQQLRKLFGSGRVQHEL